MRWLAASVMILAAGCAGHSFHLGSNAMAQPMHEALLPEMAALPDRGAEVPDASATLTLETLQRLSDEASDRCPSVEDPDLTLTGAALAEGQDGCAKPPDSGDLWRPCNRIWQRPGRGKAGNISAGTSKARISIIRFWTILLRPWA